MKHIVIIRNADPDDFGGGERFPVFLAKYLQTHFQITLLSSSKKLLSFARLHDVKAIKSPWLIYQNWSGLRVIFVPFYLLIQLYIVIWYIYFILRNKVDVLHIQSKDDFMTASVAAKLCGKRVIWTDHADLKHVFKNIDIWYKNPIGKIILICSSLASAITVVSNSEKQLILANFKIKPAISEKISIVHNGVNDTLAAHKKNNKYDFCYMGRLVKDKGIYEILDAFKRLNETQNKQFTLVVLGAGGEFDTIRKHYANLTGLHLLGHQDDPLPYLASSKIYLHASYHEGFSVALVEACMLQKSIIATAVGGNVEIIVDKKNGTLVEPRNASDLYRAMLYYTTHPDSAHIHAAAARKTYLDRFIFSDIVEKFFIPLYTSKYAISNRRK